MDPIEEQQQELEVLESIYPDELRKISDTEFSIILLLDTESDRKHRVKLHVKYPPQYPEELPDLKVQIPEPEEYINQVEDDEDNEYNSDEESDDDDDNNDDEDEDNENGEARKVIIFSEVVEFDDEDLHKLLDQIYEEANENLGMPSIFALAQSLKDHAEELFRVKVEKAQKQYDDKLLQKELEEQKKFHGTKVTKESYNEWRLKFRKEMGWDTREEERLKKLHGGRMTGKEIFEKGLGGKEDDDIADIVESVSKVSVTK